MDTPALELIAALAGRAVVVGLSPGFLDEAARTVAQATGAGRAEVLAPREGVLVRLGGAGWGEGVPDVLTVRDAAGQPWWTAAPRAAA
ncbi:hypothetical protein PYV61_26570, partial [Roseisolibacter sp. H3M3-2]